MKKRFLICFFVCWTVMAPSLFADSATEAKQNIKTWVETYQHNHPEKGIFEMQKVLINTKNKTIDIYLNATFSYLLLRTDIICQMKQEVRNIIPSCYKDFELRLYADKKELGFYIPNYFLPQNAINKTKLPTTKRTFQPLIKNISKPYSLSQSLEGHNISLWAGHGRYYNQKEDRWMWQRAKLFTTIEDKLTTYFVLHFLLPMLENAGANVFLPRERDTQIHEVIVDSESEIGESIYSEEGKWKNGGSSGFALKKEKLENNENPFSEGFFRTTKDKNSTHKATWTPDIPTRGEYAVYVSYHTLPTSTTKAQYSVFHLGGETKFWVNQKMGGKTWIYLGTFLFEKGINESCGRVELTVPEGEKVQTTADAVKFGGGMGTIGRRPSNNEVIETYNKLNKKRIEFNPNIDVDFQTSETPRYLEAARYWLQWAGIPQKVYSQTQEASDYLDDLYCRPLWVNYLNFGSENMPDSLGLGIPIDASLAFHTDAGVSQSDSIIGSLGIFSAKSNNETFAKGQSRFASRDLSDLVLSELHKTITQQFDTAWAIRGLWNKSYVESQISQVPTMLLELLSHQNPLDVRYALDPNFQFAAARAIYKGLLKFFSAQYNKKYVPQPLPVNNFSVEIASKNQFKLSWSPTFDFLENDSVKPTSYVVYTRKENGSFDNGFLTKDTSVLINCNLNTLYSFKITAVNDGGESFPSETLSGYISSNSSKTALIVNAFDRLSAPHFFDSNTKAGFFENNDCGVPYINTFAYVGNQYNFEKTEEWKSDELPGFGASFGNLEKEIIAGNSFDFTTIHGKSIQNFGISFVSCSRKSVENGKINLKGYNVIDLILGKQKSTIVGRDSLHIRYKTFSQELQQQIIDYCKNGGAILVSGAYIASDMQTKEECSFTKNWLKYTFETSNASQSGKVTSYSTRQNPFEISFEFNNTPCKEIYHTTSVDALKAVPKVSQPVFRYSDTKLNAAVAHRDTWSTFVMGCPFEVIKTQTERNNLMAEILNFLLYEK